MSPSSFLALIGTVYLRALLLAVVNYYLNQFTDNMFFLGTVL